jgi:hypothetical protein
MKILKTFLIGSFLASSLLSMAFAQKNLDGFMTSRDLLSNDSVLSNISLYNSRSSDVAVYGLYVRQYASVTPGDTCDHATAIFPSGDIPATNITAGSFVMPTTISPQKSAAVGSNYLYNLIYGAIYYQRINDPTDPQGCALPGCTWGSDTTTYNWCIYLGALAPVSTTAGYTSTVPPTAEAASSTGNYNYNLVSNSDYTYLGPISCNDQTLTCTTANQQSQSF